jgi:hypothetical protein
MEILNLAQLSRKTKRELIEILKKEAVAEALRRKVVRTREAALLEQAKQGAERERDLEGRVEELVSQLRDAENRGDILAERHCGFREGVRFALEHSGGSK